MTHDFRAVNVDFFATSLLTLMSNANHPVPSPYRKRIAARLSRPSSFWVSCPLANRPGEATRHTASHAAPKVLLLDISNRLRNT